MEFKELIDSLDQQRADLVKQATDLKAEIDDTTKQRSKDESAKMLTDAEELKKKIADVDQKKSQALADRQAEIDKAAKEGKPVFSKEKEQSRMDEQNKTKLYEERGKALLAGEKAVITNEEVRSVLVSGGTLVTPTVVGGINENPQTFPILDKIKVESYAQVGEIKVGYTKTRSTAAKGTEGAAANNSEGTFGIVAIKPYYMNTVAYVSKLISKETPVNYQQKVTEQALDALKNKTVALVVNGDGTDFYGISTAVDTKGDTMVETITMTEKAISEVTLRKIVLNANVGNTAVGGPCTLLLNHHDLTAFGDVRGTNEKKAIYDIALNDDGITGTIKEGGTVTNFALEDSLANGTMIYGKFAAFDLVLFGDYSVEMSKDEKFSEGLISILGEAVVGGNVTFPKSIAIFKLTPAA